jgi:hypothetical protein
MINSNMGMMRNRAGGSTGMLISSRSNQKTYLENYTRIKIKRISAI